VVHPLKRDGLPLSSRMSPRSFPRSSSHSLDSRFPSIRSLSSLSLATTPVAGSRNVYPRTTSQPRLHVRNVGSPFPEIHL
jgi:hypothetical protein